MSTLAQIILIITCACLVDCRYMRATSHKQSSVDHPAVISHITTKYSDAVVFPQDVDDATNKIEAIITNNQDDNLSVIKAITDSNTPAPWISKAKPVEVKNAFTNAVKNEEMVIDKNVAKKDANKEANVKQAAVINNNNGNETKIEDSANSDDTTPDLSSRFGETGNYMFVPVTVNVPQYNTQSIAPQAPTNTVQYATNIAPNIGPNQFGPIQYTAANVFNPVQSNTNAYVPVNEQKTYMINGQMYAAVTVPNNLQLLSPLYFVNPQTSGYQAQNMPMYKLVTVNDGSPQVNMNSNLQFISN